MTCCDATIIPFSNSAMLTVAYTAAMRSLYGNVPTVVVYHYTEASVPIQGVLQDDHEYVRMDGIKIAFVNYPATEIRIDNGGPASGFLKISK